MCTLAALPLFVGMEGSKVRCGGSGGVHDRDVYQEGM